MKDVITAGPLNITRELTTLLSDIFVESVLQSALFLEDEMNLNELKERGLKIDVLEFVYQEKLKTLKKH